MRAPPPRRLLPLLPLLLLLAIGFAPPLPRVLGGEIGSELADALGLGDEEDKDANNRDEEDGGGAGIGSGNRDRVEGETCASDLDCTNLACALETAAVLVLPGSRVCCRGGDYVYTSELGNVCSFQQAGAPCLANRNDLCESGVCTSGVCREEQATAGERCDDHADCTGRSCGLAVPSSYELGVGRICCPTGQHVVMDDPLGPVCTGQPDGKYCGDDANADLCDSGECTWGYCGGLPEPYWETTLTEPTRFLKIAEFVQLLQTEAEGDFDWVADVAAAYNMTLEELGRRAEESWVDASRFELARAIREEERWGKTYPYLICHESDGSRRTQEGGAGDGGESGFQRKEKLKGAMLDAIAVQDTGATIVGDAPVAEADEEAEATRKQSPPAIMSLHNEENLFCGFTMLHGTVAQGISCEGCIVQPILQSMKMMPETVAQAEALMDAAIADYYDEDDEGSVQSGAVDRDLKDFPSMDVVQCAGSLSSTDYDALKDMEDDDGTVDMTSIVTETLLFLMGWGGDVARAALAENVYFANPAAKSVLPDESGRGFFWWGVMNYTIAGNSCRQFFEERLIWKATLGSSESDFWKIRMFWNNTVVKETDQYCVLGLIALTAIGPDACQMEFTPEKRVSNDHAAWMTQTGIENEKPWHDVGLDGTGQVVAVSDTGLDVDNCYFWDARNDPPTEFLDDTHRKVSQYNPYANDNDDEWGHGTHVCGSIAGKRAINGIDESKGAADGVAPAAKLAFLDIGIEGGTLQPPRDEEILATGRPDARIHSASWGAKTTYYDSQAKTFDNYIYENDEFLAVIAAGNNGRYDNLNSVGSLGTAMNVLTVGASHSFGNGLEDGQLGPAHVADFSSRGPTADGRIKPDVIAPGKYVLSAGARPSMVGECDGNSIPSAGGRNEGLLSKAGTSMAAPVVSGTAALVRQYFEEGWYETGEKNSGRSLSPSAALVKAVLMNGAQANMRGVDNGSRGVTPVKPYDDAQGFGRVDLSKSLYLAGKSDVQIKFWDREEINDGDTIEYPIVIDRRNGCTFNDLSATLVWLEPGNSLGCKRCVLNDLDLYVTKNGAESLRYYPNGRSQRDDVNNVERVVVTNVANGDEFVLHVAATNLDDASHKYSLVTTGCFGGVPNTLNTTQDVFRSDDGSGGTSNNNRNMILIITCSVIGGVLALCCIGVFFRRRRKKKSMRDDSEQARSDPEEALPAPKKSYADYY